MSTRWAISCDTGVDDALALGVAHAHPDLDIAAVVGSAGNATLADVLANTAAVLGLLGCAVPLGIGDEHALDGSTRASAHHVHGTDGMHGGRTRLPAGAPGRPGGVTLLTGAVLATGPLTTVVQALTRGQDLERIVWMGGGLQGGNATPYAEFNAWWDPHAVDQVATSGVPLRVVPLDVTAEVRIRPVDLDTLRAAGRRAAFFGDLEAVSQQQAPHAALHDPVAVLAAAEPDRFEWRPLQVRCDLDGETAGRLVAQPAEPGETSVEVAVDADRAALRDRIVELLASLA